MDFYDLVALIRDRVDGVDILSGMPLWPGPAPREPVITVAGAACVVDRHGGTRSHFTEPAIVALDLAGDLAWRPQAFVSPQSGDMYGPATWLVTVLALIEQEAEGACAAVAAALVRRLPEAALTLAR